MKNQLSKKQKAQDPICHSNTIFTEPSRERRSLEIRRRFKGLQVRKDHLKSELQAIEDCLIILEKQLKRDAVYNQLSIGD